MKWLRFTFIVFLLFVCTSAWADWDFHLADESRITIHIQNLDTKEKIAIKFIPPVTGKPLDVHETPDGKKEALYPLRGRISPEVDKVWVGDELLVTSTGYFVYPITFKEFEPVKLPFAVLKRDGNRLRYVVTVTFIPPESIYSEFYLSQQDVLKTIFNFQLSLAGISYYAGAIAKSSVFLFPVLGGNMKRISGLA